MKKLFFVPLIAFVFFAVSTCANAYSLNLQSKGVTPAEIIKLYYQDMDGSNIIIDSSVNDLKTTYYINVVDLQPPVFKEFLTDILFINNIKYREISGSYLFYVSSREDNRPMTSCSGCDYSRLSL